MKIGKDGERINGRLADEAATVDFGRRLAAVAIPACGGRGSCDNRNNQATVIHLHGELGAGKTTLARGILRGCGFNGPVKSPTYTLVEPYELERGRIYHFDLYRLSDPREVEFLGAEDYFSGGSLCIFEWARHGGEAIPPADLEIELRGTGARREFACLAGSPAGLEMVKKLRQKSDV